VNKITKKKSNEHESGNTINSYVVICDGRRNIKRTEKRKMLRNKKKAY